GRAPPRCSCTPVRPPHPWALYPLLSAREEDEAELTDLHLVSALQGMFLDALPVDVGAVEAAHVAHGVLAAAPVELGVPAGHGDVVEEDVALRVASGRDEVAVEEEPAAGVRAAEHDEERGSRPQF